MSDSVALIDEYLDALWLERGLSENSRAAYRRDLSAFSNWQASNHRQVLETDAAAIQEYLAERYRRGFSTRTVARGLS